MAGEARDDAGGGVRVTHVRIGNEEVAIVSFPIRAREQLESLTVAERAVANLAVSGHSDREIAELRSVSISTVRNELHQAYAKLGINSRFELASMMGPTR